LTLNELHYIISTITENDRSGLNDFIFNKILSEEHLQYKKFKDELLKSAQRAATIQELELYMTYDGTFSLLGLEENQLRKLLQNVYTESINIDLLISRNVTFD